MKTTREALIQRRDTHLDQLTDKLKEPRVHRVIATSGGTSQGRVIGVWEMKQR
jgi:hypothetical protein